MPPLAVPSHHLELAYQCRAVYKHWRYETAGVEWDIQPPVFVFCGTKDLRDAAIDLRILPLYFRGLGWSPGGYVNKAKRLVPHITETAWVHGVEPRDAIFTGHSLGGAMAQCAAALLARNGIFIREVVTYGAPECGALRALADNVPLTLYANGNDVVPRILPYRTPAKQTWVGDDEEFDHPIDSYINELEKLINEEVANRSNQQPDRRFECCSQHRHLFDDSCVWDLGRCYRHG